MRGVFVDYCWPMLADVDRCWPMLTDVDRCWPMLIIFDGLIKGGKIVDVIYAPRKSEIEILRK